MPVRRSNALIIRCTSGSSAASTVWMRAVPSTWTTVWRRSRHSGFTRWVNSMWGLGIGPYSNRSVARSARTMGATGRNCSRPFTLLMRSRLSLPGWARRLRARGPGPVLARPGTRRRSRRRPDLGHRFGDVVGPLVGHVGPFQPAGDFVVAEPPPRAAVDIGSTLSPSGGPGGGRSRGRCRRHRRRLHPHLVERASAKIFEWRRSSAHPPTAMVAPARRWPRAARRPVRAAPPPTGAHAGGSCECTSSSGSASVRVGANSVQSAACGGEHAASTCTSIAEAVEEDGSAYAASAITLYSWSCGGSRGGR